MLAWRPEGGLTPPPGEGTCEEVSRRKEAQVISEEQLRKAEDTSSRKKAPPTDSRAWCVARQRHRCRDDAVQLYAAYDMVPTQELRYIHVAFVLLLSFLLFPLSCTFAITCNGST